METKDLILLGIVFVLLAVILINVLRSIQIAFGGSTFWGILVLMSFVVPVFLPLFYIFAFISWEVIKKPFIRLHICALILGFLHLSQGITVDKVMHDTQILLNVEGEMDKDHNGTIFK